MRSLHRVLTIVFMIAMLPLRGWAGEIMATEMASSHVVRAQLPVQSAPESGAAHAYINWSEAVLEGQKTAFQEQHSLFEIKDTPTAAVHDCEGHATADKAAPADASCDTCSTCQVCHTVALTPTAVSQGQSVFSPTLPPPVADHFVSTTTAPGQKPPIT